MQAKDIIRTTQKPIVYCAMQENGFRQQAGRYLTLEECQEIFFCVEEGAICSECPLLRVEVNP